MAPKYSAPSVEEMLECRDDDARGEVRGKESARYTNYNSTKQEPLVVTTMPAIRTSRDKQIDKPRRSTRSSASTVSTRHGPKSTSKTASSKRRSTPDQRDEPSVAVRHRHRRTLSGRSVGSSTPTSDEEDVAEDHRIVLASSQGRLTSPSLLSSVTTLTTATHNSGGSSGSSSTITPASISKQRQALKRAESLPDPPISPAAPDPPDVFSFLERDSSSEEIDEQDDNEQDDNEQDNDDVTGGNSKDGPEWLSRHEEYLLPTLPAPAAVPETGSGSSSTSSSSHSDDASSDPRQDNDTDRSTSPERSVKGEGDLIRPDIAAATDPSAAKIASQMLAAQHRQSLFDAFPFGSAQIQRGNVALSSAPSVQGQSPRFSRRRTMTHAKKLSITGYEALAFRLSASSSDHIKPVYRKFEGLNHRLLLHLQDELAELEEQLHSLDKAETQTRTCSASPTGDRMILPASRRGAAHAGGDLEWHKMELLNKISIKLAQYNQVLTSFNTAQGLDVADSDTIKNYRDYLDSEKVVVEGETRFLDMAGDLVVVDRRSQPNLSTTVIPQLPSLAVAVAAAILIPILTFVVIPGFVGRMTVVVLVASGIIGALIQSGLAGQDFLGTERGTCLMVYGVAMAIIAGVVA